jgi:hypothetical protein
VSWGVPLAPNDRVWPISEGERALQEADVRPRGPTHDAASGAARKRREEALIQRAASGGIELPRLSRRCPTGRGYHGRQGAAGRGVEWSPVQDTQPDDRAPSVPNLLCIDGALLLQATSRECRTTAADQARPLNLGLVTT